MKKLVYLAVVSCFAATVPAGAEDKPEAPAAASSRAQRAPQWSAYKVVQAPAVPAVKQAKWVRKPVDAFVLAQLEAKNLKPSSDADKETFIRRATLDVWGIIPTPEEVKAFVDDRSPDAYEKLVDRLLASPRYGERQARRWLDLARYADSAGFTNDETRPNMWRYRDYVINSFNQDKPYDRFVKEQIAGDELWPNQQEALIATGFLRAYADDSNSRNLVQKKYQNTTDMVDTVGTVFLGSSVECARCHNHKIDKVSQKEYFQLQAFFANTAATDNLPLKDKAPVDIAYSDAQAKYQAATKDVRDRIKALLAPIRKVGEEYHIGRFTPETREALAKRDNLDAASTKERWVINRYLTTNYTDQAVTASYLNYEESAKDIKEKLAKLTEELRKYDDQRPGKGSDKISGVKDLGKDPAPTHVLFTGEWDRPLEEVQPGIPALFNPTGEKLDFASIDGSTGRRAALAKWLSSPNNPLTARVFVNRVWGQYFGKGIVETVSDFGRAGAKPTHPELLDYLADKFVKEGWSPKKLQREILLSSTYRQSSAPREDVAKVDPDNKLLAVFPRQRLDAEQIRDSLLAASGELVDKVGGPAVFPPVPSTLKAPGRFWTVDKDPSEYNRRSIYIFTRRSVPYPMLETFDMASPQKVHSKRSITTSPLQALALINNEQVFKSSQALAGRVIREAGPDPVKQIERLYQIVYSRSPDKTEKNTLLSFLDHQEGLFRDQAIADGKVSMAVPVGLKTSQVRNAEPVRLAAFVDLTHTILNSNEFVYRY